MNTRQTTAALLLAALASRASAGRLDQAVQLREQPLGRPTRTLPRDRHGARIDINSVISIEITTTAVVAPATTVSSDGARLEQAAHVKSVIAGMDDWVAALNDSWQNGTRLAGLSKDDAQYDQVSRATAKAQRKFFSSFRTYADALKEVQGGPERAAVLRARANELVVLPQEQGMPQILSLLKDEILWLNATLTTLTDGLTKSGTPVGLAIDARAVHKGHETPIHVPGYDTIKDGVRHPYQKIHFEPTPDEQQALSSIQDEAGKLANSLQETRSLQAGLRQIGNVWVNERLSRLKTAVDQATKALEKVRDDAAGGANRVTAMRGAEIEVIVSSAIQLNDLERQWLDALKPVGIQLSSLKATIEEIKTAREMGNPQLALQTMLKTPETLASVVSGFEAVPAAVSGRASELAATLNERIRRVPQTAASQLPQEVPEIASSVTDLQAAAVALRNVSKELSDARATLTSELSGQTVAALGPDVPLVPTKIIQLEQAANTSIDVMTVPDREEGDFIRVRVAAYKMKKDTEGNFAQDGEALDEYHSDLEITKFGASSRPGGGVAFLSRLRTPSDATGSQRAQAAPTVAWMIQYRSWPKSGEDGYSSSVVDLLRPAIGIHATSPRFSSSGTDLGVGATVSVFNDLIFAGFGWDLNVATKPEYWSIGVRVIHFGSTLGNK